MASQYHLPPYTAQNSTAQRHLVSKVRVSVMMIYTIPTLLTFYAIDILDSKRTCAITLHYVISHKVYGDSNLDLVASEESYTLYG